MWKWKNYCKEKKCTSWRNDSENKANKQRKWYGTTKNGEKRKLKPRVYSFLSFGLFMQFFKPFFTEGYRCLLLFLSFVLCQLQRLFSWWNTVNPCVLPPRKVIFFCNLSILLPAEGIIISQEFPNSTSQSNWFKWWSKDLLCFTKAVKHWSFLNKFSECHVAYWARHKCPSAVAVTFQRASLLSEGVQLYHYQLPPRGSDVSMLTLLTSHHWRVFLPCTACLQHKTKTTRIEKAALRLAVFRAG